MWILLFLVLSAATVHAAEIEPPTDEAVVIVPKGDVTGKVEAVQQVEAKNGRFAVILDATSFDDPNTQVFVTQEESSDGVTWKFVCMASFPGAPDKKWPQRILSCDSRIKGDRQVRAIIDVKTNTGKLGPSGEPDPKQEEVATINMGVEVVAK